MKLQFGMSVFGVLVSSTARRVAAFTTSSTARRAVSSQFSFLASPAGTTSSARSSRLLATVAEAETKQEVEVLPTNESDEQLLKIRQSQLRDGGQIGVV